MTHPDADADTDAADLRLLKLANEKGKFAIEVGFPMDQDLQGAFERGIDNDWFTLVDLSPVACAPMGCLMRVFKLTAAGRYRLQALKRSAG